MKLDTAEGQLFDCLLSETVNLSPAAFNNVLNLSVGLLPPIQHTMLPIKPIVLATQVPTLGVIPLMGINFSVTGGAGDGGNADDGRDQQALDNPPEDGGAPSTEPEEGQEVGNPDNQNDDDVILVNSPSCKALKHSVIPLSSSGRDVGLAVSPARMNLRDGTESQLLPNPETLKFTPSMSAVAAQVLIKSAHQLIDHPAKSPKRVVETSDDKGTLEHTASFKNEGQMTSPPEDFGEEDNMDSLVDPGDPATQAQWEAAVAKIRPSVWAEDAADVKRIKQRQTAFGHVSDKLLFSILNPKLVLEDILNLIVSRLSPDIFIVSQLQGTCQTWTFLASSMCTLNSNLPMLFSSATHLLISPHLNYSLEFSLLTL